jgi:hypothetical protein
MLAALEEHVLKHSAVRLTASAGVPQLATTDEPSRVAIEALCMYYREAGHSVTGLPTLSNDPAKAFPGLIEKPTAEQSWSPSDQLAVEPQHHVLVAPSEAAAAGPQGRSTH